MWWTEKRVAQALERVSELLREGALLWMVFGVLDRVVAERLTAAWLLGNVVCSIAVWVFGVYIELRRID